MAFDENIRPDIQEVLSTSALLEISEYCVFQIAYQRWHGEHAPERKLEVIFARYLFKEEVPLWVRHFTRHVLGLASEGRLDLEALGVPRPEPDPVSLARGRRYVAITLAVLLSLFFLSLQSTVSITELFPWAQNCLLPPCY
jgi:hypothetical protein